MLQFAHLKRHRRSSSLGLPNVPALSLWKNDVHRAADGRYTAHAASLGIAPFFVTAARAGRLLEGGPNARTWTRMCERGLMPALRIRIGKRKMWVMRPVDVLHAPQLIAWSWCDPESGRAFSWRYYGRTYQLSVPRALPPINAAPCTVKSTKLRMKAYVGKLPHTLDEYAADPTLHSARRHV